MHRRHARAERIADGDGDGQGRLRLRRRHADQHRLGHVGRHGPHAGQQHGSVTNTIIRQADVGITKAVAPATATAGSNVTYTLIVTNAGPSDAEGVTVAIRRSPGSRSPRRRRAAAAARSRGRALVRDRAAQPASSATITVQATVDPARAAGPLTNTATAATTTAIRPRRTTRRRRRCRSPERRRLDRQERPDHDHRRIHRATRTRSRPPTPDRRRRAGVTISDTLPERRDRSPRVTDRLHRCRPDGHVPRRHARGQRQPGGAHFVFSAAAVPASVVNTATVAATTTDPNSANNTSTFTSSGATWPTSP